MATIARPQFLGRLSGGPEQITKAVNQATRGGNYRFMYLERRKQHYEMILKFTMQESQLKMQEEQERRKMYGEMADDLRAQAQALRKMNADWASSGYSPRDKYKDQLQMEAAIRSSNGHRVSMEEKIDKASAPTPASVGALLSLDDVSKSMFTELETEGKKGVSTSLFAKIDQHLGPGGGLAGVVDGILVRESTRGVEGLPTRIAAQDFAARLINQASTEGYTLTAADKRAVQDKVATAFGLKNADELREAGFDQAAYRKKEKAAIPGSDAVAAFKELQEATASGDTARVSALLAAEREAAAKEMDAQARALTEKATAEIEAPSYEDIITKAAGRMMPEKTPLEQLKESFNQKKARKASEFLSGGMTPEQQLMLSASSKAIKTLRENDGVLPHGDTLTTTAADDFFRMYTQGDEFVLLQLPSLAQEWANSMTGKPEQQRAFAQDLMVHFYMLKKESEGGPGLSKKLTKEQQEREEQRVLEMAAAPGTVEPGSSTLKMSTFPELKEAATAMATLSARYRLSKEAFDGLSEEEKIKLNRQQEQAVAVLSKSRAGLTQVISSPEATDDEKNLARGFLAELLTSDWQKITAGKKESDLTQAELAEVNRLRDSATQFLYEVPEGYDFDPLYFGPGFKRWHSQSWSVKPGSYDPMGTDRYKTPEMPIEPSPTLVLPEREIELLEEEAP